MTHILTAIAGLGLFLIGMEMMTEGLRGLAGGALRRVLIRFTNSPITGALTGAGATALIQSSSATTVAAVGFVGAGLMTFEQALGIIFGANVGTTLTGWVVAIVGFKLHLAQLAAPLVLIGALLRLFSTGRWMHAGWALAGFALIFIGIDTLQQGMAAYQDALSPDRFPPDTFSGRILLVMIGMAITVVTQSSSAGVATALVALNVGAISFPQAAAMVIGMDVGTTFTAALATVGGATATRRTGFAHVIYNMMTGVMAFALLSPYTAIAARWLDLNAAGDAQVALVGFHTSFNVLGTLLVVGFTDRFARLVVRLVPDSGPRLTSRLDKRFLSQPDVATDAAAATAQDIAAELQAILRRQLDTTLPVHTRREQWRGIEDALAASYQFVGQTRTVDGQAAHERHQSVLQVLDHLSRLMRRCQREDQVGQYRKRPELTAAMQDFAGTIDTAELLATADYIDALNSLRHRLRNQRETVRTAAIDDAAEGDMDISATLMVLDGIRWLHRNAYHLWQINEHLARARNALEVIAPHTPDPMPEANGEN